MRHRPIITLAAAHMVTDINQGAVPAILPFLISAYGLSYAGAAAIVFATNMSSSLVQPFFGYYADRMSKPWLMPLGILLAGVGFSLGGVVPSYRLVLCVMAVSGIGVAAFHPDAARLVNAFAGSRISTALSFFSVGGQVGLAIGPLMTTFLLAYLGLKGTVLLAVPAIAMTAVICVLQRTTKTEDPQIRVVSAQSRQPAGDDAWGLFALLTMAVFFRAFAFYGLNTFLPLYFIDVLHQSKMMGGTVMTVFLGGGLFGTLLGGRLGDRYGYRRVALFALACASGLLPVFVLAQDARMATLFLVPLGLAHFLSLSPLIAMGQKLLPGHIGLASGVTYGLAVSVGGIAAPFIGHLADLYGMHSAFMVLGLFPVIAGSFVLALPRRHPATSVALAR